MVNVTSSDGHWRHLSSTERNILLQGGNSADNWDNVFVREGFSPEKVRGSRFQGQVHIGSFSSPTLSTPDYGLSTGIYYSFIDSCTIGDNCAVWNVKLLRGYNIGGGCLLFNIGEMTSSPEGRKLFAVEVMNENGGRKIYPFEGMRASDAYLWAKHVDNMALQKALKALSQKALQHEAFVGSGTYITSTSIIRNSTFGEECKVSGASEINNCTISSSHEEPTKIGSNVILKNGIAGLGCNISSGSIAESFCLGNNCTLSLGVRITDCYIGDNSTISCCEVRNSLIFPAHEQHHNNSFLIAACIKGQSNIAAGATIGSNHNSRTPDGELVAGRGFWPGLCTSLKHSSVFASYTLLAKGSYPAELHITLPFSLVSNNTASSELNIVPAFWWMYNMYALERNGRKYTARDRRITKAQHIEFDPFAPDSMEEVAAGRKYLGERKNSEEVLGEGMENSRRKVRILKAEKAFNAYGDMIIHYAVSAVRAYLSLGGEEALLSQTKASSRSFENLGGQIVSEDDVTLLRKDIASGELSSWDEIHARYDKLWEEYPLLKARHALSLLCEMWGKESLNERDRERALKEEERIEKYIREAAAASRLKDHENPFRRATYRNTEEMEAVVGTAPKSPKE